MLKTIQDIFLSQQLILIVLFVVFLALSYWSLTRLREYIGYALGWLIGVFFMIVYASVVGEPEPTVDAQAVEIGGVTLSFLQIILASIIGLGFGFGVMFLIRQNDDPSSRRSMRIATLTALNLIVLFFLVITDLVGQRMIGIASLAFGIGVLFTMVFFRTGGGKREFSASAQGALGQSNEVVRAKSRLNQIRDRIESDHQRE